MQTEPIDNYGNISVSLENTMKLLEKNTNNRTNRYVFAIYGLLEKAEYENSALKAENKTLTDTVATLKEVIKALTQKTKEELENE